jgi:hypothetical protein
MRQTSLIIEKAPRHSESDLTGPKCQEGCASDLKIRTAAPQRERSNTPKVMRGLDVHKTLRAPRKINIKNVKTNV